MHFYCMLIDLINDYKKTFILVVMFVLGFLRWFLWELKIFKNIINKVEGVFKCVTILFKMIRNVIIFLFWKGFIGTLGGIDKKFWGLQVSFFIDLKVASKKCTRLPCFTLLLYWLTIHLSNKPCHGDCCSTLSSPKLSPFGNH